MVAGVVTRAGATPEPHVTLLRQAPGPLAQGQRAQDRFRVMRLFRIRAIVTSTSPWSP